jgi:hypothetical protein
MASPNKVFKQPEASQLPGFLASCPALAGVAPEHLELLAAQLELVRYEDGHRFYSDQAPVRRSPLRFVVQGRASWDPAASEEQKSAWMMSPGSAFGLEAVNDWARDKQIVGVWSRRPIPRVRCQAIGAVWVLELSPDRFDTVFLSDSGKPLLTKLLEMVPTVCLAPEIVAALRKSPQFARSATINLYKLLEWAPTSNLWPDAVDLDQQDKVIEAGAMALYYVISGTLKMQIDDELRTIRIGEMDGVDLFTPIESDVSKPVAVGGEAWLVTITRRSIEACMQAIPGFARTLGPRDEAKKVGG